MDLLSCQNCKKQTIIIDYALGDSVCTSCGVVQQQRLIDETNETRRFEKNATSLGPDQSDRIGGVIEDGNIGIGAAGPDQQTKKFNKLMQYGKKDKKLQSVYQHIATIVDQLEIGKEILDVSKQIVKKLDESGKCKFKNDKAIASVAIFVACREKQESRTIKEIIKILKVDKKDFSKVHSIIKKIDKINLSLNNQSAGDYAVRICTKLGLDQIAEQARKIADHSSQNQLAGKNPQTIASAAVYLLCQASPELKNKVTISEIHEILNITETTIKLAFKELWTIKEKLLEIKGE